MTLLENIYRILQNNRLTGSAEHFSLNYLQKSRSWYGVQMHLKREISATAAIDCLRSIRTAQKSASSMSPEQLSALAEAEALLKDHLYCKHAVAEVA